MEYKIFIIFYNIYTYIKFGTLVNNPMLIDKIIKNNYLMNNKNIKYA